MISSDPIGLLLHLPDNSPQTAREIQFESVLFSLASLIFAERVTGPAPDEQDERRRRRKRPSLVSHFLPAFAASSAGLPTPSMQRTSPSPNCSSMSTGMMITRSASCGDGVPAIALSVHL